MIGASSTGVTAGAATAPSHSLSLRMAYVCAAVGVLGFTPTYWLPLFTGTLTVAPILHLHAFVFNAWLALYIVQAHLVAARRTARHREFGVVGVSLATAMVFIGVASAISSMKGAESLGFGDQGRSFSVVSITGIALFAAMFAAALWNVHRPEVHKRWLLVATVGILNAAVGRLFILALGAPPPTAAVAPPPIFVTVIPGILTDMLLIPAMWHDKKRLGYVHRTYWIGGALLVAHQLLRAPIGNSEAWQAFAGWLMRVV